APATGPARQIEEMGGDLPRRPEVATREPQTPLAEDREGKSQWITQALSELVCARQRRLHLGRCLAVCGEERHGEAQLQLELLACAILGIGKQAQRGDRPRELARGVAIRVTPEGVLRRVLAVLERTPRIAAVLEVDRQLAGPVGRAGTVRLFLARADTPVQLAPRTRRD